MQNRQGRNTLRRIGRLAVALLLTTGTARAQERLLVRAQSGGNGETSLAELDISDAKFGAILRTVDLPPYTKSLPVAGGRYLILYWPNFDSTTTLALFDGRMFTAAPLTQWTFTGLQTLAADDFHPRIFYRTTNEVGVIEGPSFAPRVLRATGVDSPGCCVYDMVYAAATNAVILTRQLDFHFPVLSEILSIDAETGAVRASVRSSGVNVLGLLVDNTALAVRVILTPAYGGMEIQNYALDSLSFLSRTPSYPNLFQSWTLDVARNQILVGIWPGNLLTLDPNLAATAQVDLTSLASGCPPAGFWMDFMASTVRSRTFAIAKQSPNPDICLTPQVALVSLDAENLRRLATVRDPLGLGAGVSLDLILLSPPPPPTLLASSVAGRQVQLSWRNRGDTTHFMVEVGTIPGRSNLGILHVGNVTSWSVADVPSGTYYVRVRAGNDVGPSLPSNEVVVTVP